MVRGFLRGKAYGLDKNVFRKNKEERIFGIPRKYPIYSSGQEYDNAIAGSSGGAPDFRWTFNNTTSEEGSHSTTTNGSFSYSSSLIPNVSDSSAIFNGTDSYLVPANDELINTGTGYSWTKRSISFWFNADITSSWRAIWEEGGGVNWLTIYLQSDVLYLNIGEGSATQGHATTSVSAGTTYHCVAVVDLTLGSNQLKIYLNGQLAGQASSSVGGDLAAHSGNNNIGFAAARNHENTNNPYSIFDGKMQDFCYWNETALTATDAQNIYDAGIKVGLSSGIFSLRSLL